MHGGAFRVLYVDFTLYVVCKYTGWLIRVLRRLQQDTLRVAGVQMARIDGFALDPPPLLLPLCTPCPFFLVFFFLPSKQSVAYCLYQISFRPSRLCFAIRGTFVRRSNHEHHVGAACELPTYYIWPLFSHDCAARCLPPISFSTCTVLPLATGPPREHRVGL